MVSSSLSRLSPTFTQNKALLVGPPRQLIYNSPIRARMQSFNFSMSEENIYFMIRPLETITISLIGFLISRI